MSNYYKRYLSLAGVDLSGKTLDELKAMVAKVLEKKIHGISFSPYIEGQGPGSPISEQQIRERMSVIESNVNWVRSFSCTEGNELIAKVAAEKGLKTMVGIWLGDDLEKNEEEIAAGIEVAKQNPNCILAVGNEVLLRGDLTEEQLVDCIKRVKSAVPDVQVGYVDAYFKFEDYPKVTDACDLILVNCYPFWEGCPADYSLLYMKDMYRRAQSVANGKKVIVTETGWPDVGTAEHGAVPSTENAIKYFLKTYQWAEEEGIEIFYFSSFDETWKVEKEGDVGAYWGLWDKDGKLKYV